MPLKITPLNQQPNLVFFLFFKLVVSRYLIILFGKFESKFFVVIVRFFLEPFKLEFSSDFSLQLSEKFLRLFFVESLLLYSLLLCSFELFLLLDCGLFVALLFFLAWDVLFIGFIELDVSFFVLLLNVFLGQALEDLLVSWLVVLWKLEIILAGLSCS